MITIELNKYRNITHVPIEECAFLYDYGQKIHIIAEKWPNIVEAHFSLRDTDDGASYVVQGTTVDTTTREFSIPNEVFNNSEYTNGKMYEVYIFLFDPTSTASGRTFHKVILPTMCRPEIGGAEPQPDPPFTPEDIKRLNARVARLEALADTVVYIEQ